MARYYLAHADGGLPNLALMRLGAWFKACGHHVRLLHRPEEHPRGQRYPSMTFGSSIFSYSARQRARWDAWGPVWWGGTGVNVTSSLTELNDEVDWDSIAPDYSLYPGFSASLGFLTRGCRLRCGFCVVPRKEGKPHAVAGVHDVWRGAPHPRHLHLLDNDAFAPTLRGHWLEAVREMREGCFRVCFSQGLNLRLVDDESAAAVASLHYTGHCFTKRRLFTAWDNLGDEAVFRQGIATFARAGVPARHLTVYMLIGYDARETWDDILYRFMELVAMGCEPFPMVYDRAARPDLCAFQRWALRHLWRVLPFPLYAIDGKDDVRLTPAARAAAAAAWKRVSGGWTPRMKRLPLAS